VWGNQELRCHGTFFLRNLFCIKLGNLTSGNPKLQRKTFSPPGGAARVPSEGTKIELSPDLAERLEQIRAKKYERRPGNVSLSRFLEDLLLPWIEKIEILERSSPILEEYLIENSAVFIRDNTRGEVIKLEVDAQGLNCPIDKSRSCVHIGFAWSIPKVLEILQNEKEKDKP
jgi:hypothetical protein